MYRYYGYYTTLPSSLWRFSEHKRGDSIEQAAGGSHNVNNQVVGARKGPEDSDTYAKPSPYPEGGAVFYDGKDPYDDGTAIEDR